MPRECSNTPGLWPNREGFDLPSMTLTCAICDQPMQRSGTSAPQGVAAHNKCKRGNRPSYADLRGGHGASGYQRGCRCEVCREGQRLSLREYNRSRKARDGVSYSTQQKRRARGVDPLVSLECGYCGEPVGKNRGSEVTYHRECRGKVPAWKRLGIESPKVRGFRAAMDRNAAGTTGGARVFVAGPCEWCGENDSVRLGRFCSDLCKNNDRSARRGKFVVKRAVRLAIYERDGWVCQLCEHPVDPDAPMFSNWSATLDHIVPQSSMLIPDHSPENLRLAHLWCNSARGDGSNMPHSVFLSRVEEMRVAA